VCLPGLPYPVELDPVCTPDELPYLVELDPPDELPYLDPDERLGLDPDLDEEEPRDDEPRDDEPRENPNFPAFTSSENRIDLCLTQYIFFIDILIVNLR